jgi:hypothetical protein
MTTPLPTGVFNYLELDRVHFGTPAAEVLQAEATQRGAQRIFVVTSKSLNRKLLMSRILVSSMVHTVYDFSIKAPSCRNSVDLPHPTCPPNRTEVCF